MLDYIAIDRQTKTVRNYVAPVDDSVVTRRLRQLGGERFRAGVPFSENWPAAVRAGWLRENRAQGWADGSAYLVSQGAEVAI